VLVTGASLGVGWAARQHVLTSPRFALTDLDVVGCEQRPVDAVVAESGLAVGTNVFAIDLDAARSRILADPWIAEATLARRLPGAVLVRVTERKAAALAVLGDTMLCTPEGEPFKKLEPSDPVDLPVVTGLTLESLAADREGVTRTIRKAIELAAEYDHAALARMRGPLQEIHVASDGTFSLVVGKAAMQVALGSPPFRRKLDQAAQVAAELDRRGEKAEAILLDSETRPERVVVRMR
jgi:cell division protein FtsQ